MFVKLHVHVTVYVIIGYTYNDNDEPLIDYFIITHSDTGRTLIRQVTSHPFSSSPVLSLNDSRIIHGPCTEVNKNMFRIISSVIVGVKCLFFYQFPVHWLSRVVVLTPGGSHWGHMVHEERLVPEMSEREGRRNVCPDITI